VRSWPLSHPIGASFTATAKASAPAQRVDELVRDGTGQHFDPGRGKKMKEWISLGSISEMWIELATESRLFVGKR